MSIDEVITKNHGFIWQNVHTFVTKQFGYGDIRCDENDLYQECILYIIEKFKRSGQDDEFKVSSLDLKHVMCEYLLSLLPVKVPKATRNYSETMRKYGSSGAPEQVAKMYCDMDTSKIQCIQFAETLPAQDRRVISLVMCGYNWADIATITGESKSTISRAKKRIAKALQMYQI